MCKSLKANRDQELQSSHNPLVRRCESKRAQSFHHSGAVTRKARLVSYERELQLALARGRRLS